jgi:hypothetical protein
MDMFLGLLIGACIGFIFSTAVCYPRVRRLQLLLSEEMVDSDNNRALAQDFETKNYYLHRELKNKEDIF